MESKRRRLEQTIAASGDFGEEDREFLIRQRSGQKSSRRTTSDSRKAKQLCRQVATTLDLVLSGECHHPDLQSLRVVGVEPAPHSSRLRVTLAVDIPAEEFDRQIVEDQLALQSGRLRAEVAAAICRKRAPSLVFQLIPPPSDELSTD